MGLVRWIRGWVAADSFMQSLFRFTVVVFMAAFAVWIFAIFTGSIFNRPPTTGQKAIEKLEIPNTYRMRAENIRNFKLSEDDSHFIYRISLSDVDQTARKFIVSLKGYNVYDARIFYDGKTYVEEGSEFGTREIPMGPTFEEAAGPTKEDLLSMEPALISNEATYSGTNTRAWLVQFKPTCKKISSWMMGTGLNPYTKSYISENELTSMERERCNVKWAYMMIDHKTHHPVFMDFFVEPTDEISYRYIINYEPLEDGSIAGITNKTS